MAKKWIDRFEYEDAPTKGVSLDIYEEVPVERSGYRTIGEQVDEMIRAGETLQDWRKAQFPYPPEFEPMMETTPVFGDKLEMLDRFRFLQERRKKQAQEAKASEQPAAVVAGEKKEPPSAVSEATK